MDKFLYVLLVLPILLMTFFVSFITNQLHIEDESLKNWRLEIVADLCSDAATATLLESPNIGSSSSVSQSTKKVDGVIVYDYTEVSDSDSSVVPLNVLRTFATVYALNYNLPVVTGADAYIHKLSSLPAELQDVYYKYVKSLVIVGYDGYYYLNGDRLTPKLPYTMAQFDSKGHLYYYAARIDNAPCVGLKRPESGDPKTSLTQGTLLSTSLQGREIVIADYIMQALVSSYKACGHVSGMDNHSFILPYSAKSLADTNAVQNPSVLCVMSDIYGTNSTFTIGGAKVKKQDKVVGYVSQVNGSNVKLYTYASRLQGTKDINSLRTFDSPIEAAKEGYMFDTRLN